MDLSESDHRCWERFIADVDDLAAGVVNGKRVAADGRRMWRFVLLFAKADEEVRRNEFGLPHVWGSR